MAGSRSNFARGGNGDSSEDNYSIWDSVVSALGSVGLLYLVRLFNAFIHDFWGISVEKFWVTVLVVWLSWSIVKWVIDARREAREEKARAIERAEIEQARIAREARFKAGHRLP